MSVMSIAPMLSTWGMAPPRTDRGLERMIDRFVDLKEKADHNPSIDPILLALGEELRRRLASSIAVATRHDC